MFVLELLRRDCFVTQIRAKMCVRAGIIFAHICATKLSNAFNAEQNPWLRTLELSESQFCHQAS